MCARGDAVPVEFSLPLSAVASAGVGTATTVELRGDFSADGWEVGVPMFLEGAAWRTEVPIADGQRVHYKFVINGSEWINDPLNPETESDGLGGDNSVTTVDCGVEICLRDDPIPPVVGTFDWRSAVLYFVFVDRFNNGDVANDFVVPGVESEANYQGGTSRA